MLGKSKVFCIWWDNEDVPQSYWCIRGYLWGMCYLLPFKNVIYNFSLIFLAKISATRLSLAELDLPVCVRWLERVFEFILDRIQEGGSLVVGSISVKLEELDSEWGIGVEGF